MAHTIAGDRPPLSDGVQLAIVTGLDELLSILERELAHWQCDEFGCHLAGDRDDASCPQNPRFTYPPGDSTELSSITD